MRQPDGGRADETFCHEHEPLRALVRAADQRRRRYGTTAPAVHVRSADAHWLHGAWVEVQVAELAARDVPRPDDRVKALLDALKALHQELDPLLKPVADTLRLRDSGKPPRP